MRIRELCMMTCAVKPACFSYFVLMTESPDIRIRDEDGRRVVKYSKNEEFNVVQRFY